MDTFVILLVEDDPKDARLTIREIREVPLETRIEVARDGEEALDYLFRRGTHEGRAGNMPTLILLDLKLPKVDGLEVLREIKSDSSTKAIPVVIMTSSKEERDLVEGYRLGVNSYIQKPVDFEQFRNTIASVGHYWLSVNQPPPKKAFSAG
jgi:two-component system response regulator